MNAATSQPFAGVVQAELLFNVRRAAPYALMILFSANAVMWWGWGPAVERGWAVNSEFYIVRLLVGFCFMTLPLFTALVMGEPVVRDFRVQTDPLIFSKPVRRLEYLAGKFCGNFLVLLCCQAAFVLTLFALQAFGTANMIVLGPRLLPYLQHFAFFVVPSSLALAAICFAIGTLTRNVKVVYGVAASFYFLYIAWQMLLKGQPLAWRVALDPLLFNVVESFGGTSAASLNTLAVGYSAGMIVNRAAMIGIALLSLAIVHARFSTSAVAAARSGSADLLRLNLDETVSAPMPILTTAGGTFAIALDQFIATLGMELRLLRSERSLVFAAPIVLLACIAGVVAFDVPPEPSYAAAYASRIAETLLLFLFAIAVFYMGEAIHRDRELRVQPLLWSAPVPNTVLLLGKVAAALLLSIVLNTVVAASALAVQFYKGHEPQLGPYVATCLVLLVPSAFFLIALSAASSTLLREKHLAFALTLALGGTFYYVVGNGFHHPLYNFVLYRVLTPADALTDAWILWHRAYTIACGAFLLWLAVRFSDRKP